MSQTITLYVDGACKGNPGLGGWGAYIIMENKDEHKICGGEVETTNNRMELTAAIEGIAFCPVEAKLIIWTDSNYVKRGITEWIEGWKKKNWKDVKNPDLWKKLDLVCKNRSIEWNWIKGHSGHSGNEMADQLANLGVEKTIEKMKNGTLVTTTNNMPSIDELDKKKDEKDWLLDDPFGFDLAEADLEDETFIDNEIIETQAFEQVIEVTISVQNPTPQVQNTHPQIVITPATLNLQGPRQLILDTETTGFYYQDSDRIIEVGAVEMINRKLTGSSIHIYINPEKPVGDSKNVHGISDDFLKDKPKYDEIAQILFDYLKGAEIIAHNAAFDMNFLNMEFKRSGLQTLSEVCEVTDTLALAKRKHPGQKNSLDALVRRYEVPQRDRTFHGALLDAEILSDVYLAMTGGQVLLDIDTSTISQDQFNEQKYHSSSNVVLPVIMPSQDELTAHENWVKQFQEKHSEACLFAK
ncbi:DNA polymerase III subunit epsilon [Acinetobacter sp. ANC 4648]|uniref:DNA polymerase III subunit epsilon n=1 Tax=Acinetobacter sp. ANC 4648 TaxID=1977875 RepID=UPI000A344484|nr:DNA polymerase III subunit epsilon [Acinetobacter sp. ANC 4648]OTG81704.1 DNA polymerase III subunit epsilon [Acinetobacter sp. ANC 4648]